MQISRLPFCKYSTKNVEILYLMNGFQVLKDKFVMPMHLCKGKADFALRGVCSFSFQERKENEPKETPQGERDFEFPSPLDPSP